MEKILLLDIGNSMVDCLFYTGEKSFFFNYPSGDEVGSKLHGYLEKISPEGFVGLKLYISSVSASTLDLIKSAFSKYQIKIICQKDMEDFAARTGYSIDNTAVLAGDLFSDIVGSKDNAISEIVVDLGTATKILAINKKKFLGGIIYPGIYNCSNMLASKTELQPYEDLSVPSEIISLNTKEAIESGAVYGTALMVKSLATEIKKIYNLSDVKLIFTGGGANLIVKALNKLGYDDFIFDRMRIIRGIMRAFDLDLPLEDDYEKK